MTSRHPRRPWVLAACVLALADAGAQPRVNAEVVPITTVQMRPTLPTGLYCHEPNESLTLGAGARMRVIAIHTLHCAGFLGRSYAEVELINPLPGSTWRRGFVRDPDASLKPAP